MPGGKTVKNVQISPQTTEIMAEIGERLVIDGRSESVRRERKAELLKREKEQKGREQMRVRNRQKMMENEKNTILQLCIIFYIYCEEIVFNPYNNKKAENCSCAGS